MEALIRAGHTISLVITKPDSASGRGNKLYPSVIKELALDYKIPVYEPQSLKSPEVTQRLQEVNTDFIIVASYGLLLPKNILNLPKYGCINIHASLLPKWQGAAPIQRAILNGDSHTGVTIMRMSERLDKGDILLQKEIPILETDTSETIHNKLMYLGSEALLTYLNDPLNYRAIPQDLSKATYAHKIDKQETILNWNDAAVEMVRKIKAYNPMPGSRVKLEDSHMLIWNARALGTKIDEPPGTIIKANEQLLVATTEGVLEILELQCAGSKRMLAKTYLSGHKDLLHKKFV